MAKKGVYKITGNTHPKTGEKTVYQVTEWYPDTPNSERRDALVTWELFKKNDTGQFVTTHIKKKGIGEFTFGKQSYQSTFMVEGYLHSPERKEPMAIIVHPQKNDGPTSKERDIIGVKLTYQDGSNITKALSYMDRLRATVKCQNLEGQHLTLSLWEDDEKGDGHNKKNQFITKSPPIEVDTRGYARWNFTLLSTYITLANKREDDKKQHEYYILAEYNGKSQTSDNVNVNNPEYKIPPPTSRPAPAQKPQPKPDTPKGSTHQGSSNNQPDKKGIIKKITLVDKDGKPFKRRPTFGQTIKLIIEAQNVVGKKYNLKLWEHDSWGGDDLLYNNTHTFKADRQEVFIPLTHEMQTIGEIGIDPKNPNYGEYWTGNWQEIYAEVTLLYISTKSPIINVDIEEKPKVLDNGRSPWKMEKSEVGKEEKNKVCECEARVRAFIRMVRIGEGTGELIKSTDKDKDKKIIYIPHDFQKGYTTAFNNNKITDLSTHPQKNYGGSSAAGAYQVMRYKWWDLNGEILDKNNKKTGKYNAARDYIKKYKIPDYKPESQDKICIIIMKLQCPDLIDKIINNEIESAIKKDGCLIWASLPESNDKSHYLYNGEKQPATPLKICIEHYDKFLQEEMKGISNLHLKKGFLKEFGYTCCDEKKQPTQIINPGNCKYCGEEHYDLTNKIKWQTQFDLKWGNKNAQNVACKKACDDILNKSGLASTSKSEKYQTALENNDHSTIIINPSQSKQAIQYLNEQLKNINPVQVGVDHALNYKKGTLNEGTTDHFVVIIGKGCDNGKIYYRFYDVGTRFKEKGASQNNKLFFESDYSLKGTTVYSGQTYTVTQVRKNKKQ